jgi:hypothetical protein
MKHEVMKSAKTQLAKLLAEENLNVQHKNAKTAYFDTKNRVLVLPNWDNMDADLYDLLVGHEVGHALGTPDLSEKVYHNGAMKEKIHAIIDDIDEKNPKGVKGYLNVIEDARIEKLIKTKFPGIRYPFTKGYQQLFDRDFFGTKSRDPNSYKLIDRINIATKGGSAVTNINFTPEEQKYLDMVDKCVTFDDVVKAAKSLYEYAKSQSETDMHQDGEEGEGEKGKGEESDEEFDSDSDSDDGDSDDQDDDGDSDDDQNGDNDSDKDGDQDKDGDKDGDKSGDGDKDKSKGGQGKDGDKKGDKKGKGTGKDGKDGKKKGKKAKNNHKPKTSRKAEVPAPCSETDNAWEENRSKLGNENSKTYGYANIPVKIESNKFVVDYKTVYEDLNPWFAKEGADEGRAQAAKFKNENNKIISYMIKEFEMKKAADTHRRALISSTGVLNMNKIHSYKYSEDLFKKNTVVPTGKNHGLMMFIDWSSSMYDCMQGTLDQLFNLVMFCKRVQIPFEVYAFSDAYTPSKGKRNDEDTFSGYFNSQPKTNDINMPRFNLLNFFSSRMSSNEFINAFNVMNKMYLHFNSRYDDKFGLPRGYGLSSTPLNSAIVAAMGLVPEFQKKNRVQVMNTIFLTDGDSNCGINAKGSNININDGFYIVDDRTKAQIFCKSNSYGYTSTQCLLKILKERTGTNLVGFFVTNGDLMGHVSDKFFPDVDHSERQKVKTKYKNETFIVSKHAGYDELYIIRGSDLVIRDKNFKDIKTTENNIAEQFTKYHKDKVAARKILGQFIEQIAA